MMYNHERQEQKINVNPMCKELPRSCVDEHVDFVATCYLHERHLNDGLARENGWYVSISIDAFPRIVIPAVTHKAEHVYWQARDITGSAFVRYQSPKGPRHEAIIKVSPLVKEKGIVVVEGPMDALAAAGEGYVGFALMGMVPSQATLFHLALLLADYPEMKTLVLLDKGELANAVRVSTFLSSQGYPTRVAELPTKDLAACLPATRTKFLKQSFQRLFKQKSSPSVRKTGPRA